MVMLCFLGASSRISSSLQAFPGQMKCLMTLSHSSSVLQRRSSMNQHVSTVPRANWSSWWRTSTTAPPPRPPTPPSSRHSLKQPGPTAASTVPRRFTATSGETPHTGQPRPHVCLTSGDAAEPVASADAAHEQPAACCNIPGGIKPSWNTSLLSLSA